MTRAFLAFMVLALSLSRALAGSQIIDTAGFFSKPAIDSAQSELEKVESATGIPTLIETIDHAGQQNFRTPADKDLYFETNLRQIAVQRNAQGIVVILTRTPGRVQIDFHKTLYSEGHTHAEHARLRDAMLPHLKAKNNDAALAALMSGISSMFFAKVEAAPDLSEKQPAAASQPVIEKKVEEESNFPMIMLVIAICGVSLIVVIGVCSAIAQNEKEYQSSVSKSASRRIESTACGKCGATVDESPCPYCATAVIAKPSPPPPASNYRPAPSVTHVHNHQSGGIDPLLAGIVGYELGKSSESHHSHRDEEPSRSSYSDSSDSDSSSGGGFDFGFGGGGDSFSGGSGGDF